MVFAVRPARLLANSPVPVPSLVLKSEIVGPTDVLQHTPRAVTMAPPSDITLPPQVAASAVIFVTGVVVTVARFKEDMFLCSFLQPQQNAKHTRTISLENNFILSIVSCLDLTITGLVIHV